MQNTNSYFNDGRAHVICPCCGAEFEFGAGNGMRFVSEPTPGVHELKLKENGLDFSKFVAAKSFDARTQSRWEMEALRRQNAEEDRVLQQIKEDGYIKNTKGHRRFVTAQMFRMLNYDGGYTAALNDMSYNYQWEMLVGRSRSQGNELNTITHLERSDCEAFNERTQFFNYNVVHAMLIDYRDKFNEIVKKQENTSFYQFEQYQSNDKVLAASKELDRVIDNAHMIKNYKDLYELIYHWYNGRYYISLPRKTAKCKEWIDAYKGSGAYYTMMNLIKYHNCILICAPSVSLGQTMYFGERAVDYLKIKSKSMKGWQLLGMLKEMISYNNFEPTWK